MTVFREVRDCEAIALLVLALHLEFDVTRRIGLALRRDIDDAHELEERQGHREHDDFGLPTLSGLEGSGNNNLRIERLHLEIYLLDRGTAPLLVGRVSAADRRIELTE